MNVSSWLEPKNFSILLKLSPEVSPPVPRPLVPELRSRVTPALAPA